MSPVLNSIVGSNVPSGYQPANDLYYGSVPGSSVGYAIISGHTPNWILASLGDGTHKNANSPSWGYVPNSYYLQNDENSLDSIYFVNGSWVKPAQNWWDSQWNVVSATGGELMNAAFDALLDQFQERDKAGLWNYFPISALDREQQLNYINIKWADAGDGNGGMYLVVIWTGPVNYKPVSNAPPINKDDCSQITDIPGGKCPYTPQSSWTDNKRMLSNELHIYN